MTTKPTDHVVHMVELKAQDGDAAGAMLDAFQLLREYRRVLQDLEHSPNDMDAVSVAEDYRQLIGRLRKVVAGG